MFLNVRSMSELLIADKARVHDNVVLCRSLQVTGRPQFESRLLQSKDVARDFIVPLLNSLEE